MWSFLPALACATLPPGTGAPAAAREPDPGLPGGLRSWVLGPVQDCDAPLAEPSWTDASEDFGGTGPNGPVDLSGSLLLARNGDASEIVATQESTWLYAGWPGEGWALEARTERPVMHVTGADLDGDGSMDILAAGSGLQVAFGPDHEEWTELLPFVEGVDPFDVLALDADGDGDTDLVALMNSADQEPSKQRPVLLRNDGDGSFGEPEGLGEEGDPWGAAFDGLVADLDGDTTPDVYVCNDFGVLVNPNMALLNDGYGHFEPGDLPGAEIRTACMGVSAGDLDADGELDLFIAANAQHFVLLGDPGGFVNVTAATIGDDWEDDQMAWGSAIVDLDNDGLADIVEVTAGFAIPGMEPFPIRAWHQLPGGSFEEIGASIGLTGSAFGRGLLARDLDGDGIVDLVVADYSRPPWVFLSDGCTAESWLEVRGPPGAQVTVEAGGVARTALLDSSAGYGSQGPPQAHFGLGGQDLVERVTIDLPWRGPVVLEGPLRARRWVAWSGSP